MSATVTTAATMTLGLAPSLLVVVLVRNDGALGGYKWGVERKKTLLERERRQSP